jgi:DNA topoisomerase-1
MEEKGLLACRQYNSSEHLAITRYRTGEKRFYYRYASGRKVSGKRILKRINQLVIPPKWESVLISKDPKACIQVIGCDEKERRQYIYHPSWHEHQQALKFDRLCEFGNKISAFRQRCVSLVEEAGWQQEKACALVCLLLDNTGARVGNAQYSKVNNTFGLTTLRRKHLKQNDDDTVSLHYVGKHGKQRQLTIEDPALAALVNESSEKPGYCLFRYQNNDGKWQDVTSDDVNQFIHENLGNSFSCKDFRTWAASRHALMMLPRVYDEIIQASNKKWESTLSKSVSKALGNTPNVCRKYYIHPNLFALLKDKQNTERLILQVSELVQENLSQFTAYERIERLLLRVISAE